MYSRILLATDGSRGMASAMAHAIELAQIHNAELHVLYVVDVRSFAMLPSETRTRVRSVLTEEGETATEALKNIVPDNGIQIVPVIVEGLPHEEILKYAEENEIDLIVMGTHGQSGEEKRVVGSVAEEVVRKSQIPILIIRMQQVDLETVQDAIPDEQQRYIA